MCVVCGVCEWYDDVKIFPFDYKMYYAYNINDVTTRDKFDGKNFFRS